MFGLVMTGIDGGKQISGNGPKAGANLTLVKG
jgi:hypothetical protein